MKCQFLTVFLLLFFSLQGFVFVVGRPAAGGAKSSKDQFCHPQCSVVLCKAKLLYAKIMHMQMPNANGLFLARPLLTNMLTLQMPKAQCNAIYCQCPILNTGLIFTPAAGSAPFILQNILRYMPNVLKGSYMSIMQKLQSTT